MQLSTETTTKFKVDISELKSGIQEANKNIKLANAEFKAASAGLDNWAKSSDGVSAKLKQLSTVLDAQKTKLKNYESQYEALENAYDENGKRAEELKQSLQDLANQGVSKTSDEYKTLEKSLAEVEKEQASNRKAADNMKVTILNQKAAVSSTEKEIRNYENSLADIESEAKQTEDAVENLNEDVTESGKVAENVSGGFTVLKGAIANLLSDGIKAVLDGFIEVGKEAFTMANDVDRATNTFISKTGSSVEAAEDFEDVISSIYKNNYGETFEDIADSMATVKNNLGDLDNGELQKMTEGALLLRDTFDYDINETTRTAAMLMKQFGIDGETAYSMIATGAQNGLDKNGDLLDTLNEYSVHYKQLGFDVDDMLNMLVNGTETGTFSVDKLGDAVKEFGIRTKDTAASTDEGFELIGLSADEMREAFAKGGESAQDATKKTLEALFNMDDQVKQNQAGVDLFGTMWEDLGIDGVKALMDVTGEVEVSKDALNEINDVKYNDIGSTIEGIKRTLKTSISDTINNDVLPSFSSLVDSVDWEGFGQKVGNAVGAIVDFFKWIVDNKDTIITALTSAAAGLGAYIAYTTAVKIMEGGFMSLSIAQKAVTAAQWLMNTAMSMNPIGLVIAAVVALVTAFVLLWKKSDAFREFWINLWEKIKETASKAWAAIKQFFSDAWTKIKEIWQSVSTWFKNNVTEPLKNFFSNMWTNIKKFASDTWTNIKGIWQVVSGWFKSTVIEPVRKFFTDLWNNLKTGASNAWNGIKNAFSSAVSFFKDTFTKAWNAVKKVFSSWGSFFGGLWDTIKNKFSSIGTNIANAIGSAVKSGINGVLSSIESTINSGISLINSALSIVGSDGISYISLPRLAKGGIIDKAMAAIIGEDGKEAVVPLEKNTGWMDEIASRLAEKMNNAPGAVNNSNVTNVTNNFYQTNNSPKALSRLDIYRQSKNLLRLRRV